METENAVAKPKTRLRRFLKGAAIVGVSFLALLFVARTLWRFSGSNRWELVRDQNGVKVYTLKAPGSDLIQVMGVTQIHSTMAGLVKFMTDPDACKDYHCHHVTNVEHVDDQLDYVSFQFNTPFPFRTRELLIRQEVHQNARTKEVLLVFAAAPDEAPPNDCCFRITNMSNTWRLTPQANGQIGIVYLMNMNEGGYLPDLLLNWQRPKLVYRVLRGLQGLVERPKYQTAKLAYIAER
jgi:hypothetical protein